MFSKSYCLFGPPVCDIMNKVPNKIQKVESSPVKFENVKSFDKSFLKNVAYTFLKLHLTHYTFHKIT